MYSILSWTKRNDVMYPDRTHSLICGPWRENWKGRTSTLRGKYLKKMFKRNEQCGRGSYRWRRRNRFVWKWARIVGRRRSRRRDKWLSSRPSTEDTTSFPPLLQSLTLKFTSPRTL
uniref:Uncharacterized protein n=1 Tax=Cacopsylla melanoneura TaxID=428564 RepID=A0A8D8ZWJ2_9HEMI